MLILNKVKPKTNTTKENYFNIWRMITIVIAIILTVSILGSGYFAYTNIYLTLGNAQSIFVMESNIEKDNVDAIGYEKARDNINKKKEIILINKNLRNIFEYATVATTTLPNATSTLELN